MGIASSILLFVGVPVAVILGLGFVLNTFREPILGAARSTGEVFSSIFTEPIRAGITQVAGAFSDLPDIDIRIPGINVSGGLFTFTQDQPVRDISGEVAPVPGGEVTFGEDTTFDPNTGIIEGSPPMLNLDPLPEVEAAEFTPVNVGRSFLVAGERLSRAEIISNFPEAIGLFDVGFTPGVDFLPLGEAAVRNLTSRDIDVRLTGQLFSEISNVNQIGGA